MVKECPRSTPYLSPAYGVPRRVGVACDGAGMEKAAMGRTGGDRHAIRIGTLRYKQGPRGTQAWGAAVSGGFANGNM